MKIKRFFKSLEQFPVSENIYKKIIGCQLDNIFKIMFFMDFLSLHIGVTVSLETVFSVSSLFILVNTVSSCQLDQSSECE